MKFDDALSISYGNLFEPGVGKKTSLKSEIKWIPLRRTNVSTRISLVETRACQRIVMSYTLFHNTSIFHRFVLFEEVSIILENDAPGKEWDWTSFGDILEASFHRRNDSR